MNIPFLSFGSMHSQIKEEMMHTFENFFDGNWFVLGESVKQFEKEYSDFNKVNFCVGISNGLDALHIALKTLEIGKNDEVIIPSNTFIASALAVSYVDAIPVFVEPDIYTYNIDVKKIEAAITLRTKAIIPVHLYGQSCDMETIMNIAERKGLSVIEDNAQSQGAAFNSKLTGSWGQINATSFYPGKNLGALGDAGAITTNNETLADKAKMLRNYGSTQKYHHEVIGYNQRMDECQAAFLSVKLKYLKEWTESRRRIAAWYDEALKGMNNFILPLVADNATHVYHLYVVRTKQRDALQNHLASKGIGTLIHYPIPPHLQKAYEHLNYRKGDFPIAEEIAATCLSLPLWPGMTEENVQFIAESCKQFFK